MKWSRPTQQDRRRTLHRRIGDALDHLEEALVIVKDEEPTPEALLQGAAPLLREAYRLTSDRTQPQFIDFDRVVGLLREHGIPAYVEQTGGGVATIYAGEPYEDGEGDTRYPVLVGPGWFDGPRWTEPRGQVSELWAGPDDDGLSTPHQFQLGDTEETVVGVVMQKNDRHMGVAR